MRAIWRLLNASRVGTQVTFVVSRSCSAFSRAQRAFPRLLLDSSRRFLVVVVGFVAVQQALRIIGTRTRWLLNGASQKCDTLEAEEPCNGTSEHLQWCPLGTRRRLLPRRARGSLHSCRRDHRREEWQGGGPGRPLRPGSTDFPYYGVCPGAGRGHPEGCGSHPHVSGQDRRLGKGWQ